MVLELHVWGPGFGLPSLDPECLAAIAYFTQALDRSEWIVVYGSPSAVPTRRLPTLHDPLAGTWTASLPSIISHLALHAGPIFHSPDAHLSPSQLAKSTAYASYLAASAAPLLSLSLYASTTNWTTSVRPAYSSNLPFPLGWTEVTPLRRSWISLADSTRIDLLDAEDAERQAAAPQQPDERPGSLPGGGGDVRVTRTRNDRGIKDLLTPEQRARIRLHSAVDRVMDVLQDLKGADNNQKKKWFLTTAGDDGLEGDGGGPTSLDCVAFGYLALMVYPDLPRPWLRDRIVDRYPALQAFANDMTAACFGDDGVPTATATAAAAAGSRGVQGAVRVAGRFVDGAARNVPWLGEEWARWRDVGAARVGGDVSLAITAGGSIIAVAALVAAASYVLRRRMGSSLLLPLLGGAPVHRWEAPRKGLAGFGAAGALFGGMFAPEVGFAGMGGVGDESGRVQTEVQAPFGGKVDGVEVDADVDID